jgi:retinol dehydrogenase-14
MRIVLVGRDAARAETTAKAIISETGNSAVEYLVADLSSQEQVRGLAAAYRQRHDRLHVLLNNAGGVFAHRTLTVDGLEHTFALNHLAPFLLTNLLLETLQASGPARIVTVASMAHSGVSLDFSNLQHERGGYRAFNVYSQTKLANILFTYELARRLHGSNVTANTLHPGFVASNFGKGDGGVWKAIFTLARPVMINVERGAKTSIYLASSPEVEGISGNYFVKCKPARSSRQSYDEAAQRQLWTISEQLTALATAATPV